MSCCKACEKGKKSKCSGAGTPATMRPKKRSLGFKQRLPDKKIETLGKLPKLNLVKKADKAIETSLNRAQQLVAKHLHPKSIRVSHKNNKKPSDKVIGRI